MHVPKTGGNSIQRTLLPFSEDRVALLAPHQDGLERFEIRSTTLDITKHSTLRDYQRQLPDHIFKQLFKFSCTRNPWDRCVSFFFSPHRGSVEWSAASFERFIIEDIEPTESYLNTSESSDNLFDNLDGIIRFEHLENDFHKICGQLGIDGLVLPHVNASRRADYRDYYVNDDLIELVARKFALEIDTFGYTFG